MSTESSMRCMRSMESPRSSAGMPPHDVVANSWGWPSTSSHVIGTFESTAPGMSRREVRTRRADGVPRSCAGSATSTSTAKTAVSTAPARQRRPKRSRTKRTGGAASGAARLVKSFTRKPTSVSSVSSVDLEREARRELHRARVVRLRGDAAEVAAGRAVTLESAAYHGLSNTLITSRSQRQAARTAEARCRLLTRMSVEFRHGE